MCVLAAGGGGNNARIVSYFIIFHRISSHFIAFRRVSSYFIVFYCNSSCFIVIHCISSRFSAFNRISSQFIVFHRFSSFSIVFHRFSSYFITYHRVLSCFIVFHRISSYSIVFHYWPLRNWTIVRNITDTYTYIHANHLSDAHAQAPTKTHIHTLHMDANVHIVCVSVFWSSQTRESHTMTHTIVCVIVCDTCHTWSRAWLLQNTLTHTMCAFASTYGLATISRLLKIIGIFCRI